MDLLDFEAQDLYFDEAMPAEVEALLKQASELYAEGKSEPYLLKAYAMLPTNLSVLVALYRFYYYQHRFAESREIAYRAMAVIGQRLRFPDSWRRLTTANMGAGALRSMGLVRFYLHALKGAAYLSLRLDEIPLAADMLRKLVALDPKDRLGVKDLLSLVEPEPESVEGLQAQG